VVLFPRKRIAKGISYGGLPSRSLLDASSEAWDIEQWRMVRRMCSPYKVNRVVAAFAGSNPACSTGLINQEYGGCYCRNISAD